MNLPKRAFRAQAMRVLGGAAVGGAALVIWLALLHARPSPNAQAGPTSSPDATASASAFATATPAPSTDPRPTATPALAVPDGLAGSIAYVGYAEDSQDTQIFLLDLATSEVRQLTHLTIADGELTGVGSGMRAAISCAGGPYGLTWSPDGTLLAFSFGANACDAVTYTVELDGTLHRIGDGHSPSWSPDGAWIVYAPNIPYAPCGRECLDPALGPWNLKISDPFGTDVRALTNGGDGFAAGMPHVGPDGSLVAFSGPAAEPPSSELWATGVYVIPSDGGGPRHLVDGGYPVGWTPDGRVIVYLGETYESIAINPETLEEASLGSAPDGGPWLSPDGATYLVRRYDAVADAGSIELRDVDGGALRAEVPGDAGVWAPSGTWFATSHVSTGTVIRITLADGTALGAYQLDAPAYGLAWRPEG